MGKGMGMDEFGLGLDRTGWIGEKVLFSFLLFF